VGRPELLLGVAAEELTLPLLGQDRLAHRGGVRRAHHAVAVAHPHRPGALDAVDEAHRRPLEDGEAGGLLGLLLQVLRGGADEPADVDPADRRQPDSVQRRARAIGAVGAVLQYEVAAAQGAQQPVRGRARDPELLGGLRDPQCLALADELQQHQGRRERSG
jgi:hypothetical protein